MFFFFFVIRFSKFEQYINQFPTIAMKSLKDVIKRTI